MHWYLDVLKRYTDFNGRARRQEFWMFVLFHTIVVAVLAVVDTVVFAAGALDPGRVGAASPLATIYALITLPPTLAVNVRRLHDIGFSGWMLLLHLVPFGGIVPLIYQATDSKPGDNAYGPNPNGVAA